MLGRFHVARTDRAIAGIYRRVRRGALTPEDREAIAEERAAPERRVPETCYFICFVNRSGTTYLAERLSKTRQMGFPQEYLNFQSAHAVERLSKRFEVADFRSYLDKLVRRRQSANGIFGTKISFAQLAYLHQKGYLKDFFPNRRFVMVRRRDLVMQAISWFIAEQTRAWASFYSSQEDPVFDERGIIEKVQEIITEYSRFENYFALTGIQPLRLVYEDLVATPDNALGAVWEHLGCSGQLNIDPSETRCQIQRTRRNYEWAERIRRSFNLPSAERIS